ncbi:MAG: hypothetical protein MJK13_09810 [Pseudomonadales bacterium]|nr:hypothetical protein [Pseudomonadales bacterium]NRA18127.1 hypothetical protein [Oceanospirillaceae bacterium]
MSNKSFVRQRICIYAGQDVDPNNDEQVGNILKFKLEIQLPQRSSMDEALAASTSDHEIIALIIRYRAMR